jgi:hypothetical protein
MTLEVELLVGVATSVAAEAGRSLLEAVEEGGLDAGVAAVEDLSLSCKERTPPSSVSPKLSLGRR